MRAPPEKRQSGSNFHLSFFFLPKKKRQAMFEFYQFCRYADDIVDDMAPQSLETAKRALEKLRKEINLSFHGRPQTELGKKIAQLRKQFPVQEENFLEIIQGCEMDLSKKRYQTFEELQQYCYYVASAVGLVCKEIFGSKNPSMREYAINLGLAFQLTNILRDLVEDAGRDRIYLPLDDVKRFGYSEGMLLERKDNKNFHDLMEYETHRALGFYETAAKNLRPEDQRNFLPAQIMKSIYFKILQKIMKNPSVVFQKKVSIPKPQKILLALKEWIRIV